MFKQRLIMTLILVPLVLLGIYYLPPLIFGLLAMLLMLGLLNEWQQFVIVKGSESPWFKLLILVLGSVLVLKFWKIGLYFDLAFWVMASCCLIFYPKLNHLWSRNSFIAINAWILVGVFTALLMELQADDYGKNELVAVMLLVWAADTGAYLFGRRWGQHKMIPLVSPGKSWEGLFGGILSVCIVGSIEIVWMNPFSLMGWYAVILITGLVSVVGDLWISMLKRRSNIKDSGHVIPGHGGLLDRMDSLLAALPVFYCCLNFLNNN